MYYGEFYIIKLLKNKRLTNKGKLKNIIKNSLCEKITQAKHLKQKFIFCCFVVFAE